MRRESLAILQWAWKNCPCKTDLDRDVIATAACCVIGGGANPRAKYIIEELGFEVKPEHVGEHLNTYTYTAGAVSDRTPFLEWLESNGFIKMKTSMYLVQQAIRFKRRELYPFFGINPEQAKLIEI